MTRKPILALAATALTALSLGLAACGSSSSSSAAAPETTTAAPAATTAPATSDTTATTATAPAAAAGTTVDVTADPNGMLAFTEKTLTAPAGSVTFTLTNDSPVPHNIAVKGGGGVDSPASDTIQGGDTAEITVDLPAGTYEYYCEIPGHEAAGMKGEITVK